MLPFWLTRADPLPAALRAVPLAMLAQGGSQQEDPKQVFVGGIPKEASEDAIKKYFDTIEQAQNESTRSPAPQ